MTEFYVQSNLTPREAFNLHGTLPASMIERLLDQYEIYIELNKTVLPAVGDAELAINEAYEKIDNFLIDAYENDDYNDSLDMNELDEAKDMLLKAKIELERIKE
jgi:hypothetical protein